MTNCVVIHNHGKKDWLVRSAPNPDDDEWTDTPLGPDESVVIYDDESTYHTLRQLDG